MSKQARSARGEVIDFDLLAIKQQLASSPTPVSVNQRRKFIDEKAGFKQKIKAAEAIQNANNNSMNSALNVANSGVAIQSNKNKTK